MTVVTYNMQRYSKKVKEQKDLWVTNKLFQDAEEVTTAFKTRISDYLDTATALIDKIEEAPNTTQAVKSLLKNRKHQSSSVDIDLNHFNGLSGLYVENILRKFYAEDGTQKYNFD